MPGLLPDQQPPQGQGLLQRFFANGGLAGLLGMQPLGQRMVAENQAWNEQAKALGHAPPPAAPWSPEATELADLAGAFDFTGAIKAYHGSPHTFDRFDMSKIGTGEGAQAYGHGLYFAENPGVAADYRAKLAGHGSTPDDFMSAVTAKFGDDAELKPLAEMVWGKYLGQGSLAARKSAEDMAAAFPDGHKFKDFAKLAADEIDKPRGSTYTVNLDVNHDDLLDWDAPLSQQPEKVRKALGEAGLVPSAKDSPYLDSLPEEARAIADRMIHGGEADRVGQSAAKDWATLERLAPDVDHNAIHDLAEELGSARRGNDFYESLGDSVQAAQALRAAGIPGIRYLDQGSRATSGGEILGVTKGDKGWTAKIRVQNRGGVGFSTPTTTVTTSKPYANEAEALAWAEQKTSEGSRNIVMFDDQLAQILERNGQPVKAE